MIYSSWLKPLAFLVLFLPGLLLGSFFSLVSGTQKANNTSFTKLALANMVLASTGLIAAALIGMLVLLVLSYALTIVWLFLLILYGLAGILPSFFVSLFLHWNEGNRFTKGSLLFVLTLIAGILSVLLGYVLQPYSLQIAGANAPMYTFIVLWSMCVGLALGLAIEKEPPYNTSISH